MRGCGQNDCHPPTAAGRAVEVLSARSGPLGQPPLVSINQPTMERTLEAAIEARGDVDVWRGMELDSFDQRAGRVDAILRPTAGIGIPS